MNDDVDLLRRGGFTFVLFAVCGFALVLAAWGVYGAAGLLGARLPDGFAGRILALSDPGTLRTMVSAWLLAVAAAIAFPRLERLLPILTLIVVELAASVLGAATGATVPLALTGNWWPLVQIGLMAVAVAFGFLGLRYWSPMAEFRSFGGGRWALVAVLCLGSPMLLGFF